jgi:intein/homing endonuclease
VSGLKKVNTPKSIDENVAEFLGIMTGDGCVNKYTRISDKKRTDYYISITGNSIKDVEYYDKFLSNLIRSIFGIVPKYSKKKNQNTIDMLLRYKELYGFFDNINFNKGPKDKIDIPVSIKENDNLARAFLRGLFDTDGSISWKKEKYPVISIMQKSRKLIESVCYILDKNGFSFNVGYDKKTKDSRGNYHLGSRVYICGKKNLFLWNNLVGSNHPLKKKILMGSVGFEPTTIPA